MSQNSAPQDLGHPLTPPTAPGAMPPARVVWPSVVGALGVLYASFWLLCNTMGFFMPHLYRWGASLNAQNDPAHEAELQVVDQLQLVYVIETVVAEILTIWLLIASIALLRRRPASRSWLIGWSIAESAMTAITVATHALMAHLTAAALRERGLSNQVDEAWFEAIMEMIFTLLISMAAPLFMLIWFTRKRVVDAVAQWRSAGDLKLALAETQ